MVRTLIMGAGYAVLYAALAAWAPPWGAPGALLWAPVAGLNVALLAVCGLAWAPLVFGASAMGGLFLAELTLVQAVLTALLVTAGASAAAAWLRRRHDGPVPPSAVQFVGSVAVVALAIPAVVAPLAAGLLALLGWPGFATQGAVEMARAWWLADAAGILTLTPLLMAIFGPYVPAWGETPASARGLLPPPQARDVVEFVLELGGLALAVHLAFFATAEGFLYFFCLIPLGLIAWQHGLLRTLPALALLAAGTVLALGARGGAEAPVVAQVFLIVLALAGLLLGALVADQRHRLHLLRTTMLALEAQLAARSTALEQAQHDLEAQIAELSASRDALAATSEEQADLNEKLRTSEAQLKELNARKDKFFSIVSHDVRNMLVSAIGFSKLLISDAETLPRDMIREFASHVHSSTTNTYDLLENLLTWARMQTGRMYYQRAWHGIDDLIDNNLNMLQHNAARKGIQLERQIDRAAQVYADRNMINSVLQNLISNAIKFTRRGGRITISSRTFNSTVEIAVSDTGVGMRPEDIEKLFRIDVHHSSEGTEAEEGTGLGLVLCKEMVERNEGKIWVESEVGKGSTFRFTLPCASPAEAVALELEA